MEISWWAMADRIDQQDRGVQPAPAACPPMRSRFSPLGLDARSDRGAQWRENRACDACLPRSRAWPMNRRVASGRACCD
jgi:hypothetical protein